MRGISWGLSKKQRGENNSFHETGQKPSTPATPEHLTPTVGVLFGHQEGTVQVDQLILDLSQQVI